MDEYQEEAWLDKMRAHSERYCRHCDYLIVPENYWLGEDANFDVWLDKSEDPCCKDGTHHEPARF